VSHRDVSKAGSIATMVASLFVCIGAVAAESVKVVVLTPEQGELEGLLRREAANAANLGRAPFVEITAEWCAPCKALRASLDDPSMRDAFAGTYIIQVDFDAWEGQLKAAGLDSPGIPVFFAIDGAARPTGATIDGSAWGEDVALNMAPPLRQFFRANGAKGD
jgi:thiol:disulfide interchange protein